MNHLLWSEGIHYTQSESVASEHGMIAFRYSWLSPGGSYGEDLVYCESRDCFLRLIKRWNRQGWVYFPVD
jgi:hypothetical protein